MLDWRVDLNLTEMSPGMGSLPEFLVCMGGRPITLKELTNCDCISFLRAHACSAV